MNKQNDISWLRIGAEGVVIVASILFAFAIDAWWAERQDRATEQNDLKRLHAEFVWNSEQVGRRETSAINIRDTSEKLYDIVSAHLGQDEPLRIEKQLVKSVIATPTFDAVTPVLEGLIVSGQMDNIRDQEVISALIYWQRQLKQTEETQIDARAMVFTHLDPVLIRHGNMGPAFRETDSVGHMLIRVDEELVGSIGRRVRWTRTVARTLGVLKTAANDVIAAVELTENQ